LRFVPRTDDPEIRARQKHVARVLLDMDPELREEVRILSKITFQFRRYTIFR
jgi:hypothetical protein